MGIILLTKQFWACTWSCPTFSPTPRQEGIVQVEPVATAKLMDYSFFNIKGKFILKACWTDLPYVCWGEPPLLHAYIHIDEKRSCLTNTHYTVVSTQPSPCMHWSRNIFSITHLERKLHQQWPSNQKGRYQWLCRSSMVLTLSNYREQEQSKIIEHSKIQGQPHMSYIHTRKLACTYACSNTSSTCWCSVCECASCNFVRSWSQANSNCSSPRQRLTRAQNWTPAQTTTKLKHWAAIRGNSWTTDKR